MRDKKKKKWIKAELYGAYPCLLVAGVCEVQSSWPLGAAVDLGLST